MSTMFASQSANFNTSRRINSDKTIAANNIIKLFPHNFIGCNICYRAISLCGNGRYIPSFIETSDHRNFENPYTGDCINCCQECFKLNEKIIADIGLVDDI
jgi:hypothetical protein